MTRSLQREPQTVGGGEGHGMNPSLREMLSDRHKRIVSVINDQAACELLKDHKQFGWQRGLNLVPWFRQGRDFYFREAQ